jgi:ribosomal protein S18 acetylase RimI-like enzyme
MARADVRIAPALSRADLAAAARLFEAYAASLSVDLAYQDFAAELTGLPGAYASPAGALLIAREAGGRAVGCVALRPMAEAGCAEMKRLYVAPSGRGASLGRRLVEAALGEAARLGYGEVRLDTLPDMAVAIALYRKLGFREITPYYATPVAGTLFFGLTLRAAS